MHQLVWVWAITHFEGYGVIRPTAAGLQASVNYNQPNDLILDRLHESIICPSSLSDQLHQPLHAPPIPLLSISACFSDSPFFVAQKIKTTQV